MLLLFSICGAAVGGGEGKRSCRGWGRRRSRWARAALTVPLQSVGRCPVAVRLLHHTVHPPVLHLPCRRSQGGVRECPQRRAGLCAPPAAPSPSPCRPRPRGLPNTLSAAAPPAALPSPASVSPRRRGRAGGSGERRRGRTGGRGRPCPAPAAAAVAAAARSCEKSRAELRHRCPLPAAARGGGRRRPRAPPARRRSPCAPSRFPPPPAAEKMRSKGRKESLSDSRDLDGSYDQLTGECRPRGRCSSRSGSPPPRPRPRPASSPGPGPRRPASPAERRSVAAAPAPGGHRSPGRLAAQWETTLILPAGAGAFESLPAAPQPASRIAAQDSGVSRQPPGQRGPPGAGPPRGTRSSGSPPLLNAPWGAAALPQHWDGYSAEKPHISHLQPGAISLHPHPQQGIAGLPNPNPFSPHHTSCPAPSSLALRGSGQILSPRRMSAAGQWGSHLLGL